MAEKKQYSQEEMDQIVKEMETLKKMNKKYYGIVSRVRRTIPYVLGLSAATAVFAPRVMAWNHERDQYLTEDFTRSVEELYAEHGQAVFENAKQMLGLDVSPTQEYMVDHLINYPFFETIAGKLQEQNPDLYNKIFHKEIEGEFGPYFNPDSPELEAYAKSKGFENIYELQNAIMEESPIIREYGDVEFKDIPADLQQRAITEALDVYNVALDAERFVITQRIQENADELLGAGIDPNSILDQPILFSGNDDMFNIHYTAGETTPKDILNMQSDGLLDLSNIPQDTLFEMGLGAALVGVGTAVVAGVAEHMTRNKELDAQILGTEKSGIRKYLSNCADQLKSMSKTKTIEKKPKNKDKDGPSL